MILRYPVIHGFAMEIMLSQDQLFGSEPENIIEVNGRDLGIPDFREITRKLANHNIFQTGSKSHKCLLINEAHGMSKGLVEQLLTYMERTNASSLFSDHIPSNVFIIFTTTKVQEKEYLEGLLDANPLISRCIKIVLTNQKLAEKFADRARQIATIEGLDGRPAEDYYKLAQKCQNNMRMILQRIASGEMMSDADAEPEPQTLTDLLKEG